MDDVSGEMLEGCGRSGVSGWQRKRVSGLLAVSVTFTPACRCTRQGSIRSLPGGFQLSLWSSRFCAPPSFSCFSTPSPWAFLRHLWVSLSLSSYFPHYSLHLAIQCVASWAAGDSAVGICLPAPCRVQTPQGAPRGNPLVLDPTEEQEHLSGEIWCLDFESCCGFVPLCYECT